MIIAAYAGVGKTTFCTKNQGNAIDVVCMPFKYSNFYEVSSQLGESEDIKANEKLELRDKWELYYYWAVKYLAYYCPKKYIVIPTINSIMDFLEADNIPYTIFYPNVELKDEYEQRYLERGNSESFMDVFIGQWDYRLESLAERKCKKIVLESHQYLSDVIDCSKFDDTYISRQLISFENALKWENSRVKRAKTREIDEYTRAARHYYSKTLAFAGFSRLGHTINEVYELIENNSGKNDSIEEQRFNKPSEMSVLIRNVIQEINLHYNEYSNEGDHLKFTDIISLDSISSERETDRCIDSNNYLNVRYNPNFKDWTALYASHISIEDIEKIYLRDYLSMIIGVLRKGNNYLHDTVSDNVDDETLINWICTEYKNMLIEACAYKDGEKSSDAICGILYVKPLYEKDIVDDFVLVNSKKQLKFLLEDAEEGVERKICFSLLSAKYIDDCYQFQEKVFESKDIKKLVDFL